MTGLGAPERVGRRRRAGVVGVGAEARGEILDGRLKFGDAAQFEFQYNNGPKDKIEDFFTFTIPTSQTRTLDISLTFDNTAVDLDLLLFKLVEGNLQAIAVSNGAKTTERLTPIQTLGAGTYFIGVSSFDDPLKTGVANYTLSVTPTTPCRFRSATRWHTSRGPAAPFSR